MSILRPLFLTLFLWTVYFLPSFASGEAQVLIYNGTKFYLENEKTTVDLGVRKTGTTIGATIRIQNKSDQPLLLTNVRGSCGLSVPSWPRSPIQPGEEANLQIRYDSSRLGEINRNVTLHSNARESRFILPVKGEITP